MSAGLAGPVDILAAVLVRLHRLHRLRSCAEKLYGPGAPGDRVRASEVAALVARAMRREDSGWFRRELTEALRVGRWRSVRKGNVPYWCGIRRRT